MALTATEQVARYFAMESVRPHLVRLIRSWNTAELLGTDLANDLRDLVREQADKANIDVPLDEVDWNELAERYARDICGVDDDELERRLEKYV